VHFGEVQVVAGIGGEAFDVVAEVVAPVAGGGELRVISEVATEPVERVTGVARCFAVAGRMGEIATLGGEGGDGIGEEEGIGAVEKVVKEAEAAWRGVALALGLGWGGEGGHGRMVSLGRTIVRLAIPTR
jgi:hypothetical protein